MYNRKVPNMLKPTILTAKHYDTKVSVEFEYSDVSLDEVMDGFQTLLMGMGFSADGFKQWVIDRADEYVNDLAKDELNDINNNYNDYGQLINNTTYKI